VPRGLGKPAAFVLATLLALPACARSHPAPPLPTRATACAEGLEPLPGRVLRGFAFAHDYVDDGLHGYGSDESRESLSALRGLGSNAVSISPYGFVPSIRGSEITHANALEGGETDARVRAVIRDAHARGLAVLLKPQLWIHGGAYTGALAPRSDSPTDPLVASYRAWILGYARLAAEEHVEAFAVGTELRDVVARAPSAFRALIAEVRRTYRGRILYAANWDEASAVPFLDAIDALGVQFYPPLTRTTGTPEERLEREAGARLARLVRVAERAGKKVWITEVGYRADPEAAIHPHAWPEHRGDVPYDPSEQARVHRAFFRALAAQPGVEAVFVWKWFTDPASREESRTGFSPRGKAAEAVVRRAFGGCGSGAAGRSNRR